jgi:hypothetical protein
MGSADPPLAVHAFTLTVIVTTVALLRRSLFSG